MEIIVEMKGVHKAFGNNQVLKGLDLTIESGKIYAILGHNGAGKTTTCRLIQGLYTYEQGAITVFGLSPEKASKKLSYQLGILSEDIGLYENLTIKENILFFAKLYGMKEQAIHEALYRYLDFFELVGKEDALVQSLSRGMKKKVAILRTMIHEPGLLILDEPLNGLDPVMAEKVCQLIHRLKTEKNMTVIITSHHLDEVEKIVDDYVIIKNGVQVEKSQREEATIYYSLEVDAVSIPLLHTLSKKIDDRYPMTIENNIARVSIKDSSEINDLLLSCIKEGIGIQGLKRESASLKEVYMHVGV